MLNLILKNKLGDETLNILNILLPKALLEIVYYNMLVTNFWLPFFAEFGKQTSQVKDEVNFFFLYLVLELKNKIVISTKQHWIQRQHVILRF